MPTATLLDSTAIHGIPFKDYADLSAFDADNASHRPAATHYTHISIAGKWTRLDSSGNLATVVYDTLTQTLTNKSLTTPTLTGKATIDQIALAASTELTIATGAVTTTAKGFFRIDTESDAASDDLDTINGGAEGIRIVVRAEDAARTVVLKHNTGNILTFDGQDITLDEIYKVVEFLYDSAQSKWVQIGGVSASGGYLPLSGGTMAGTVNFADNVLQRPEIKDYAETLVTDSDSTATHTINLEDGNVHDLTLTANCTLTFSNPPATGRAGSFTLVLRQDATGSRTVTWPASVLWAENTAPTLSTAASAIDILTFMTLDGGTTWFGFVAGQAFA